MAHLFQRFLDRRLRRAIGSYEYPEAQRWLRWGANPNGADENGMTALHVAASHNGCVSHNGIELLLKHGANITLRSNWDATPLLTAASSGSHESATLLLDYGASANERLPDGRTALMLAVERLYPEMVELLIQSGADVNARDEEDLPVLHYTALYYDPGWNLPIDWVDDSPERQAAVEVLLINAGAVDDYD
ncbi:MAG: ankyrin repeat domain-containing protein [Actinomycetota bacterium]